MKILLYSYVFIVLAIENVRVLRLPASGWSPSAFFMNELLVFKYAYTDARSNSNDVNKSAKVRIICLIWHFPFINKNDPLGLVVLRAFANSPWPKTKNKEKVVWLCTWLNMSECNDLSRSALKIHSINNNKSEKLCRNHDFGMHWPVNSTLFRWHKC